jgi:4a-hydroxytetrahydrobiopterin dehydratase
MAPRDEIYTPEQVDSGIAVHEGWQGDTSGITKSYAVAYDTAIRMVADIGVAAIELEHRPDIDIRWDCLRIFMTTHTAGDVVTELDFLLAARIDEIAAAHGARSR